MLSTEVAFNIGPSSDKSLPSTLGAAIRRRAQIVPNQTAMLASGFEPLSYWELQCLIDQTRASLRGAGFDCKARIVVAIPNWSRAALGIVVVACSAVCIPFDLRQTLPEIERRFAALRPDGVLLFKDSAANVRQVAERMGIKIIEPALSKDDAFAFTFVESLADPLAQPVEPDEPDPD